jgi:arylsulfatase A-like enzyme
MLRRSRLLLTVGTLLVAGLASAPSYAVRLNSLSLDVAPLAPNFQGSVFNYTATAPASAAQARVTASPAGFGSTVTVNGVRVTNGVPSAPLALAVGQTTITVRSTGRAFWWSAITTDTYRIVVTRPSPGSPPSITSIQAEPANAAFRTPVVMTGTASDPEDGDLSATIAWSSNRDGSLGVGATVTAPLLSAGAHTITARVTDSSGTSASATVAVLITNTPPVVTASASATEVNEGEPVTFSGTAADAEDGDLASTLRWTSSRDGLLGVGASITETLSVGLHAITATATDGAGASTTQSLEVRVIDPDPGPSRPNILFILADDFGSEASALYPALSGNSGQVSTPNLQALAANGLVFDTVWANPVCSPTRAAIVSGLYGHQTGVTNVGNVLQPATTTSIFEFVAASSPERYGMGVFGKWHLGTSIQHVRDTGVPAFRGFLSGGISNYYNWNATAIDGTVTNVRTYATTALTDYAIQFIQNHRQQSSDPWFVYLPYNAPHGTGASTGFQVPPANLHTVDLGGLQPGAISDTVPVYKAMIQALDTEIGRLLAAIGPVGSPERDNTVVIFMGDNGTPAAVKDAGARIRGSKSGLFEGGIRVPLVVSGPGVTRLGEREDHLVVATDLYATLAELSGIPVSDIGNSYSLLPLLSDPAATTGRSLSFSEMCSGTQAFYAVRDDRYKLSYNNGTWRLYDLANDAQEATNRFADPALAGVRTALEAELDSLAQSAQFGCFR